MVKLVMLVQLAEFPMNPDVISALETARTLGVCHQTLRRWRQKHIGPRSWKNGRRWVYSRYNVLEWRGKTVDGRGRKATLPERSYNERLKDGFDELLADQRVDPLSMMRRDEIF